MISFSKNEALLAAEQFCYGIESWARQFTEDRSTAESLELDLSTSHTLHQYDSETQSRLRKSVFYEVVDVLYDFAIKGEWDGKTEFTTEEMARVSDEVHFYFTELCRFDEVFTKAKNADADLIFMGLSQTDCYLDVFINEKHVLDILTTFTSTVLARWKIVAPFADSFTLEELSILSGLNLKTVRNSLSSKGADKLNLDEYNQVAPQEAIRWLNRKRGFSGPFCLDVYIHYSRYESIGQLTHHCESLLRRENKILKDVIAELKLSNDEANALKALMKSREDVRLKLITPSLLKDFGTHLKASELNVFVIEGSKVISTTVAYIEASKLF